MLSYSYTNKNVILLAYWLSVDSKQHPTIFFIVYNALVVTSKITKILKFLQVWHVIPRKRASLQDFSTKVLSD